MLQQLGPALRMMLLMTLVTGLLYPAIVTGLCQVLFHHQANGSLVVRDGQIVGSRLLAQGFSRPEYFHPRPSAAGTDGYDAAGSSGSNLGPTSAKLIERVKAGTAQFHSQNPEYRGLTPADAVTASGSGLDPDISPETAAAQCPRIAQARKMPVTELRSLVQANTRARDLGFLGEPRVNVLELNLQLDKRFPGK